MSRVNLHDSEFELFLPKERILEAIADLAGKLDVMYEGKDPLLVTALKGGVFVACDLARTMRIPVEMEFVRVASYEGTESSGTIRSLMGLDRSLQERHVVIVEDIVDTGRTLHHLKGLIQQHQVASLTTVTLLDKPSRREVDIQADLRGIEIPDLFVVGVGLDYKEKGRDLPDLYALCEE